MRESQCSVLLLLFHIFAAVPTVYGQSTDYAAVRRAGRAEFWAGHYEKAETLLSAALEVARRNNDDDAAAIMVDLGVLYQSEERLIEAEREFNKALSIFRRIPDRDYETAVALRNLATIYSIDRPSEALKALQEALKLLKKNTPDEQELAVQIRHSQSIVYFRQGKTREAETLLAQAMGMRSRAAKDSDLLDAQILSNLGAVSQRQRKYDKAEQSFKRSLEITEQLLGPAHPYASFALENLGDLYIELRRHGQAEGLYRRSLDILEQMSPVPARRIVATLQSLSRICLQKGQKADAESMLARAVAIARRSFASDPETPKLLEAYGEILKSLGKPEEAQQMRSEARRMRAAIALTVRLPN